MTNTKRTPAASSLQPSTGKAPAFFCVALPTAVADAVRTTRVAPRYGHPAYEEIATGYGPCRHCLKDFRVGREPRILFTYDPFEGVVARPLPGPVFIHAEACARYPERGGFPEGLRAHALTLNAYGPERRVLDQVDVVDGALEPVLEGLLARAGVAYVHVRDTEAGCYDLRVERATAWPQEAVASTAAVILPHVEPQST